MSFCPECDTHIAVAEETRVGWVIFCPDCQTLLEVASREPLALIQAPEQIEGDWGD